MGEYGAASCSLVLDEANWRHPRGTLTNYTYTRIQATGLRRGTELGGQRGLGVLTKRGLYTGRKGSFQAPAGLVEPHSRARADPLGFDEPGDKAAVSASIAVQ
jgi:hypothetical protein